MSYFEINSIIILVFLSGLTGGLVHCIGMCGPFVISQTTNYLCKTKIENFTSLKRLSGIMLIPYHMGRITTYTILCLISTYMTRRIQYITNIGNLSSILLFIAGIIFLLLALGVRIKIPIFFNFRGKNNIINFLLKNPFFIKGYFLGIFLGFLPCGLLYGIIFSLTSLNDYFIVGVAMISFGIGTMPSLIIVSYGSEILVRKFRNNLSVINKFVLFVNAITLFIISFFSL